MLHITGSLPVVFVETLVQPELGREERVVEHGSGSISIRPQKFRQCVDFLAQPTEQMNVSTISTHLMLVGQQSAEQAGERRQCPPRVGIRSTEPDSIGTQRIDMRTGLPRMTVESQVIGPQGIDDDDDDRTADHVSAQEVEAAELEVLAAEAALAAARANRASKKRGRRETIEREIERLQAARDALESDAE